jgi:[acyl-carrier-protein] S-malonyltransferase
MIGVSMVYSAKMKLAFLFPGQEPVTPRMGLELAHRSTAARALLERVAEKTGVDIFRLLKRGGSPLNRSEIMQPTLVAITLGVFGELTAARISPELVAGLSLGEISAWCAMGCISSLDAVDLAVVRGRIMGQVAARHPGGLLALWVSDEATVEEALRLGRTKGTLTVASRNSPEQVVLSGDEPALRLVAGRFDCTRLPVPGAWHSPLMEEAVEDLRGEIKKLPCSPETARFICNRTGEVVDRVDLIPDLLAEQLTHPVLWTDSLQTLARAGVTDYLTVGPGKVMRSLLRRTLGAELSIHATDDLVDLDETIDTLQARQATRRTR